MSMSRHFSLDSEFKQRRVLITGANGFIGAHLLRRLLLCGAEVAALVRGNSNIWRLGDHINSICLINGDLRNPPSFSRTIATFNPEYVFHLAAYGASYTNRDIWSAISVNITGIANLIHALKESPCRKLVNVGSGLEYGAMEGELTEEMAPAPVSIYGSTKAAANLIAHQLALEYDISIITLRPFGVFGEGEDHTKFFTQVILSLLENQDIALTGCEQYRDFCYVENIVDGILAAALHDDVTNEILNIAGGRSYPLKYYVELLYKHIRSSSKPLYGAMPYRINEIWYPAPSIAKIKSLLGWEPRFSLEEGIKKTIAWYKENRKLYLNHCH